MIARHCTESVIVATPTGATTADAEGQPIQAMASTTVMVHTQPYRVARESEQVLGAEEAERARTLWAAADAPITHRSTVTRSDGVYEVRGDPKRWEVGGRNDHIEVTIVRVVR